MTPACCAFMQSHRKWLRGARGSRENETQVGKSQVENGQRLEMVGPNGLEPSTSSVSGRRSNQLSYGPTSDRFYAILRAAGKSGNVWKAIPEEIEIRRPPLCEVALLP